MQSRDSLEAVLDSYVCVDGLTIETTHSHTHTEQNGRVRLWEVPLSPLCSEVLWCHFLRACTRVCSVSMVVPSTPETVGAPDVMCDVMFPFILATLSPGRCVCVCVYMGGVQTDPFTQSSSNQSPVMSAAAVLLHICVVQSESVSSEQVWPAPRYNLCLCGFYTHLDQAVAANNLAV